MLIRPANDRYLQVIGMLLRPSAVQYTAPAVALAWIVLFISGRWESESGWVDRAGRAIGFLWIALFTEVVILMYGHVLLF